MPVAKKSFEKNKNSIQNAKMSKKTSDNDGDKTTVVRTKTIDKDGNVVYTAKSMHSYSHYEDGSPVKSSNVKKEDKKIKNIKSGVEVEDKNKKYTLSSNPPQGEMEKNK